jgi:hypothetical protein
MPLSPLRARRLFSLYFYINNKKLISSLKS